MVKGKQRFLLTLMALRRTREAIRSARHHRNEPSARAFRRVGREAHIRRRPGQIPSLDDNHPLSPGSLARSLGAGGAVVWGTTRRPRRRRGGKRPRPSVGRSGPPGVVAALARCTTSRCVPRLPGGPLRPMRWAIIIEIWYEMKPKWRSSAVPNICGLAALDFC